MVFLGPFRASLNWCKTTMTIWWGALKGTAGRSTQPKRGSFELHCKDQYEKKFPVRCFHVKQEVFAVKAKKICTPRSTIKKFRLLSASVFQMQRYLLSLDFFQIGICPSQVLERRWSHDREPFFVAKTLWVGQSRVVQSLLPRPVE